MAPSTGRPASRLSSTPPSSTVHLASPPPCFSCRRTKWTSGTLTPPTTTSGITASAAIIAPSASRAGTHFLLTDPKAHAASLPPSHRHHHHHRTSQSLMPMNEWTLFLTHWPGGGGGTWMCREAATYRCQVLRDAGLTKADENSYLCVYFARGKCVRVGHPRGLEMYTLTPTRGLVAAGVNDLPRAGCRLYFPPSHPRRKRRSQAGPHLRRLWARTPQVAGVFCRDGRVATLAPPPPNCPWPLFNRRDH